MSARRDTVNSSVKIAVTHSNRLTNLSWSFRLRLLRECWRAFRALCRMVTTPMPEPTDIVEQAEALLRGENK